MKFNYGGEFGSGDKRAAADVHGFLEVSEQEPLEVGDIALWHGTGERRWELGWVVEIRRRHPFWQEYLVQSVFDGSRSWLTDNGIAFLERGRHQYCWHWTDRQLALKDRWLASGPARPTGVEQPVSASHISFGADREVTLVATGETGAVRETYKRSFPDWRKVTKAQMGEFLAECATEHARSVLRSRRKERRGKREAAAAKS
ncbi:hypothetical protein [uncultured Sphingomonas sp.]|uniref:hypothetical protein n=1 Tax=uncultured Sphingomonas sp. TaxID=158754 RepID=UPI0025E10132|nr:hypothetical protein [uncultured Sphingomonas sp.]